MKKIKVLLLTLLLIVTTMGNIDKVAASSGSVSMSTSASSITVGNTVTVTITFSCRNGIGGANFNLTYNTGYYTLKSTTLASADYQNKNGVIKVVYDPMTSSSSATVKFVFTSKATGSSTFTLTTQKFYDYDIDDVTGYSDQISKKVTINKKQTTPSGGSSTTPTLSSDNTLSSIAIEGFQLDPQFSSDLLEYKIYLPKGTEKLNITAKPSSSKATVGTINGAVKEGWNEIKITCTAENKAYKTYVINAYVEETPTVIYQLNGEDVGVVKNLDNLEPLANSEKEEIKLSEEETIIAFKWYGYQLLYLENSKGEKDYYIYDKTNNNITSKFVMVELDNRTFVINDINYEDYSLDENTFKKENITLNETVTVKGWGYNDVLMNDYKIVVLGNENGQYLLYRYDRKDNTVMRYQEPAVETEEKDPMQVYVIGMSAVSGILALLLLFTTIQKNRYGKKLKNMR